MKKNVRLLYRTNLKSYPDIYRNCNLKSAFAKATADRSERRLFLITKRQVIHFTACLYV